MVELKKIELNQDALQGLPVFFHKIYFNRLDSETETNKLNVYRQSIQSITGTQVDTEREISKLINKKNYIE